MAQPPILNTLTAQSLSILGNEECDKSSMSSLPGCSIPALWPPATVPEPVISTIRTRRWSKFQERLNRSRFPTAFHRDQLCDGPYYAYSNRDYIRPTPYLQSKPAVMSGINKDLMDGPRLRVSGVCFGRVVSSTASDGYHNNSLRSAARRRRSLLPALVKSALLIVGFPPLIFIGHDVNGTTSPYPF